MKPTESPTGRSLRKEATRKLLLETALSEYALKGITTTPTSDVARAAGVAHGTVFLHFPTQEALVSAAIADFGERITSRLHQLVAQQATLGDVLRAHLRCLEEFEGFYTRLVVEGRLLPTSTRTTLLGIQTAISFHLAEAAEREARQGLIAPCPSHLLFNTWLGLVHYYLSNGDLFAPDGSVLQRYGPELIDHLLGLLAPKITKEVLS